MPIQTCDYMAIGLDKEGNWTILLIENDQITGHHGSYATHQDAIEHMEIMVYRMKQGWAP